MKKSLRYLLLGLASLVIAVGAGVWFFLPGIRAGYADKMLRDAARHGQLTKMKLALFLGAGMNNYRIEDSPLVEACQAGQTEAVKLLLDRGANYDQLFYLDEMPGMFSPEYSVLSLAVDKACPLLPPLEDKDLDGVLEKGNPEPARKEYLAIAKILLRHGAGQAGAFDEAERIVFSRLCVEMAEILAEHCKNHTQCRKQYEESLSEISVACIRNVYSKAMSKVR